ncbi:MAG: hypothetical protein J6Y29_02850 [Clostridiales bacterium]|nr:hypothetical protein [Clostridiales bacterium]
MFKKIAKILLFVFLLCVFCNVTGQVSYARKVINKPNLQVTQKRHVKKDKLPIIWKPNSELKYYGDDGELIQIRSYGPDGRALQDIDYKHGGSNHKFPHTHDWDWSVGDNNPTRGDDVPLPGAKELPPKQKKKNPNSTRGQKSGKNQKKIDFSTLSNTAKITATLGPAGTIVYFVISEGSRIVFPIRNIIPMP